MMFWSIVRYFCCIGWPLEKQERDWQGGCNTWDFVGNDLYSILMWRNSFLLMRATLTSIWKREGLGKNIDRVRGPAGPLGKSTLACAICGSSAPKKICFFRMIFLLKIPSDWQAFCARDATKRLEGGNWPRERPSSFSRSHQQPIQYYKEFHILIMSFLEWKSVFTMQNTLPPLPFWQSIISWLENCKARMILLISTDCLTNGREGKVISLSLNFSNSGCNPFAV